MPITHTFTIEIPIRERRRRGTPDLPPFAFGSSIASTPPSISRPNKRKNALMKTRAIANNDYASDDTESGSEEDEAELKAMRERARVGRSTTPGPRIVRFAEVLYGPDPEIVELLNSKQDSVPFMALSLMDGGRLGVGDVAEFASEAPDGARWLSTVVAIRRIKEQGGRTNHAHREFFIRSAWFYSKGQFELIRKTHRPLSYQRWEKAIQYLGANEVVSTDHEADWLPAYDLLTTHDPAAMLDFDDRWPTPITAAPVTDHPLRMVVGPSKSRSVLLEPLPLAFFGDDLGEIDNSYDGMPYTRAHFDFTPSKEAMRKAERDGTAAKRRERAASGKVSVRVIGPSISFNLHSTSRRPYDPSRVQYFSRKCLAWLSVDDLDHADSYRSLFTSETPSCNSDKSETSKSSDSGGESSEGEAEEQAQASASMGLRAAEAARPRLGCRAATTFEQDKKAAKAMLAQHSMVRGGAYGLVGNAVIYHRTEQLVERVAEVENSEKKRAKWQELWRELIDGHEKWHEGVELRKKKGMVWGHAGAGKVWVCPESGDPLSPP